MNQIFLVIFTVFLLSKSWSANINMSPIEDKSDDKTVEEIDVLADDIPVAFEETKRQLLGKTLNSEVEKSEDKTVEENAILNDDTSLKRTHQTKLQLLGKTLNSEIEKSDDKTVEETAILNDDTSLKGPHSDRLQLLGKTLNSEVDKSEDKTVEETAIFNDDTSLKGTHLAQPQLLGKTLNKNDGLSSIEEIDVLNDEATTSGTESRQARLLGWLFGVRPPPSKNCGHPDNCPPHACRYDPAVIHGYCCGCAHPTAKFSYICPLKTRCPIDKKLLCSEFRQKVNCCCPKGVIGTESEEEAQQ